ncbi:lipocalin family protein [Maribacter sp. 2304DJ31-5]|uniref:lipocalin family protein n=1 Tax=Maribacter sp. 2304DJ31-5 TaxID=3386273 RepID=UPI0039BD1147
MKKSVFTLLTILCISCSKEELKDTTLQGEWVLDNVVCFCGFGPDYDFSSTTITFNTNENKISIRNSGEFTFLRDTGTYSYTGEGNRITMDNERFYVFDVEDNTLTLIFVDEPNIADDEVTYSFIRP